MRLSLWMLVVLYAACTTPQLPNPQIESIEIPVTKVFQKDIIAPVDYVASIQALQNVEIRARIEGYLEAIYVDEGKEVTRGQLLFKINDQEYQAKHNSAKAYLKSAEAEFKSAMVELERVKLLVEKSVIAKTEIDLAEAKVETAKAKIEQAKADEVEASVKLLNTQIRSPFNGIIDRIPFKLGSLIDEGTLLTTISDINAVHVYFNVSEIEYLKFFKERFNKKDTAAQNIVELLLADGSIYSQKGRVETMESEFETGTGAIAFRARFENPLKILKHGSTGKVRITETIKDAMLIPQKSTLEIQDKNYVFLVDRNNMLIMKSFDPLQRTGDYYIIKNGLTIGDQFVYEGVQSLREGGIVKPVMVSDSLVYPDLIGGLK
jgi:membrane fusion protein (multidrug efflux system)